MRRIAALLSIVVFGTTAFAQRVAVKKVELAGEQVIVHYDLEDSNPANDYQIFLYSSQNNFTTALTHVTGDVGNEVKPGANRKIIWDIRKELGPYKGKLSLEVRGQVYAPFVKLQGFDVKKKYKRGKSITLTWKANSPTPVHIELFRGSLRVGGENNHPNNGLYSITIPAKAKPGKDYRIKFTDSRNGDEIIYTGYFQVVPKIPLLLKIAPIVVAGGAAALLAPKPSPGGGGGDDNGDDFIALPDLPGGN